MSAEPKTWVDTLREMAISEWVMPRLKEHFPDGVPTEAFEAVVTDLNVLFDGQPLRWFNLRRLVLSVTNETIARVGGGA